MFRRRGAAGDRRLVATLKRSAALFVVAAASAAALGSRRVGAPQSPPPPLPPADLVVINGAVYEGGGGDLRQALAIRGNRIALVGANDDVDRLRGPRTVIVDAHGGAVLPGFNDIHTHMLSGGLDMDTVNLQGA